MNRKKSFTQTLLLALINVLLYAVLSFVKERTEFNDSWILVIFLVLSFLLSGLCIFTLNQRVYTVLEEIKRNLVQFNEGNFTTQVKVNTNQQDLISMTLQIEKLKNMFNTWIYELLHTSVSIKLSADKINGTSQRTEKGMGELSKSLSQIRIFFEETVGMLTDTAAATTQLALSSSNIANSSSLAVESVQEANNAAINGGTAVSQVTTAMHQIKNDVSTTSRIIEDLEQSSKQIDEITDSITAISNQTNMLALNAAIEAARAGEHGKGFAVVSEEVRKLSEETREAALKINGLIRTVQKEVSEGVTAMRQVNVEVDRGSGLADHAKENLNNILMTIEHAVSLIESISGDVTEQSAGTDLISENTDTVAKKGEKGISSVQKITSLVEAQFMDIHQNNLCAKELLSISGSLEEIMEKFDRAIGEQMLEASTYVAELYAKKDLSDEDLMELCKETGLTELQLINEEGIIIRTNNKDILGFQFSNEEGTQTFEFLKILEDKNIRVNQKSSFREVDGKLFKYTGLSMKNKKGIVQCGLDASKMADFKGVN